MTRKLPQSVHTYVKDLLEQHSESVWSIHHQMQFVSMEKSVPSKAQHSGEYDQTNRKFVMRAETIKPGMADDVWSRKVWVINPCVMKSKY